MRRLFLTLVSTSVLGLAAVSGLHGSSLRPIAHDPVSLIEQDFHSGKLTLDERAIYTVRAIRNPSLLPTAYQAALGSQPYVTRDPTMVLRDIRINWNLLADSTQKIVSSILTRWNTAFSYVSPSGFFRLHYDTTGSNAVPTADSNNDGIPDYVEKCAAYADSSLAKQLSLGYMPPPSDGTAGGDSLYDIYFEEMPTLYGYCQPENPGPAPWNQYTSYLVLNRNYFGFPPNQDPEGNQAGAAKVTCAHEFHHAIQFGYNVNQPSWYMEEDATSMETIVYPKVNDNYNYLPFFFSSPETSLMDETIHEYACFIWGLFLAQKFDTSLTVAAWQGGRYHDIFQTISDTLMGRYGWTEDSAMAEFAVWNFCTNSRNDGLHFRDAANYPLISIERTHSTYPVPTQSSPSNPAGYASCYVQFLPGSYTGKLRLVFQGNSTRNWAAYVIKSTSTNVHQFQKLKLNPSTFADTVDIYGFESYAAVTLVGINLSADSSGAGFGYSAQVLPPYSMRDMLAPDSALYSGATRSYKYKMWNTSSVAETVKLVHWDQAGWMVKDSTSEYLTPGDSASVLVSVHPPVGTPLGTISPMHFKTVSLNDSTINVEQVSNGTVFLQRGDLNFNGVIDLGDLSYLVAYLTGGGAPPIPVMEAGNFNCVGIVDLSDLTALVAFLTGTGPRCPCNPY